MTQREVTVYLALDRARDALKSASACAGGLDLTPFQTELLKAKAAIEAAIRIHSSGEKSQRTP